MSVGRVALFGLALLGGAVGATTASAADVFYGSSFNPPSQSNYWHSDDKYDKGNYPDPDKGDYNNGNYDPRHDPSPAPEPAVWELMFAGLAGLAVMLRFGRRSKGVA